MIWLTWRQYRVQTLVALAALAVIAAVLVVIGVQLHDSYDSTVATCQSACESAKDVIRSEYNVLFYFVAGLLIAVPGIIGIFWGAPLIARELETGTHRLVWNQSISRTRWFVVKLAAVGLTAVAITGLLSLLVTWAAGPLDKINVDRFTPLLFDARGIVPLGYAAFAFTVGACAGLLIRRTVPAMAATLVVFVAVQVLMPFAIRPHLMSPERTDIALSSLAVSRVGPDGEPGAPASGWQAGLFRMKGSGADTQLTMTVSNSGAWVVSDESPVLDSAGKVATGSQVCPNSGPDDLMPCLTKSDLHMEVAYQPSDRYWTFQWIETGLFLVLTGLLAGFSIWWLRSRLA
ncbi:ABC transporter permease [Streptomyces sp. NPDC057136]|uniref:ABC transporter permease n=1 Tax=Streptomyces sp. NPDC057136 TaxID=3346029 RepID=UPI003643CE83